MNTPNTKNLSRRSFLYHLGIGAAALTLPRCNAPTPGKSGGISSDSRPNIVFIMADDMGYGDVGCYNPQSLIPTPAMDRLATEGVRFTDAHTPAAMCTPTRYGLLTGRYCWRTRLKKGVLIGYDEIPLIEPNRKTIADLLRNKGYSTAYIGKWHLGLNWPTKEGYKLRNDENKWQDYTGTFQENEANVDFTQSIDGGPVDRGFDYFYGTAGCSTSDSPYVFIENRHTVSVPTKMSPEKYHQLPGFLQGLMADDWSQEDVDPIFTEKAIDFIESHSKGSGDTPFFLCFSPSSPHIPWLPPDFIQGKSKEGPRGDLIALVDWCVGQILDVLDKHNLRDNTLVIVTSDNGPRRGANGHRSAGNFRGYKANIWEGGHRVPFIVRWPGKNDAGQINDEVISLTDLFATFAALTETELSENEGEDSYNILPVLLGKSKAQSSAQARIFHSGGGAYAIRKGQWKLIQGTKGSGSGRDKIDEDRLNSVGQLYDMENDPYEQNDLWDKHPEIVSHLTELLDKTKQQGYSGES